MINYTDEFKKKVRSVYGSSMDKYLDTNNGFLGRVLDDSSQGGISIDKILSANSLETLQRDAELLKLKKELYSEYWKQPGVRD